MKQLMFDEKSGKLVEEIYNYWQNESDYPDYVKKFIKQISDKMVIYELKDNKYFCNKCFKELDENFNCPGCGKPYPKVNGQQNRGILPIRKMTNIKDLTNFVYYYFWEVYEDEVYLYVIREKIYFDNPIMCMPFKTSSLVTEAVYQIKQDRYISLIDNEVVYFEEIKGNRQIGEDYGGFYQMNSYIYTDNLDNLKNTVYRYSRIWEAKDYLSNLDFFGFLDITYAPVYISGFENLIKLKFYSLAFNELYEVDFDEETKWFLNKKNGYLDFMMENNFNGPMFNALKKLKVKDEELINYYCGWCEVIEDIEAIKVVDVSKLRNYLMKQENEFAIIDYRDYLHWASIVGLDLDDKNVLWPNDLMTAHDELYLQVELLPDKDLAERIKSIAKRLAINKYEDDDYVIFPADSIESLLEESRMQHNCVRTYCIDYSYNKTQIYLMRKKTSLKKSFVTIEVKNGKVVQARAKYNETVDEDVLRIIKEWERNIKVIS